MSAFTIRCIFSFILKGRNIQLFPHLIVSRTSEEANAAMLIGTIGGDGFSLLGCSSQCFSKQEEEALKTRVCAVSYPVETYWASIKL